MSRLHLHPENHLVARIGWLRAAVLGANDGIVSTASLIVGVVAAAATQNDVLIAGIAGLAAGAMSMAAGEYVSVSSQSDTEQADLARERKELKDSPEFELDELDGHLRQARCSGRLVRRANCNPAGEGTRSQAGFSFRRSVGSLVRTIRQPCRTISRYRQSEPSPMRPRKLLGLWHAECLHPPLLPRSLPKERETPKTQRKQ